VDVDVRILAATNKNLEEEIKGGRFRADLYYRLNVIPIHLPVLAERREDIPLLVNDFLQEAHRKGMGKKEVTDAAMQLLMSHDWPGNVRELRNMIERLVIMSPGTTIGREDVGLFLGKPLNETVSGSNHSVIDYSLLDFKQARKQFEHDYIKEKLLQNNGNVSKTAEQIGMERSHLHKKVKALGIELE
jgi:two-component system nitrogen regulation response regulator NtrX